jgi:hypothetical protein
VNEVTKARRERDKPTSQSGAVVDH